MTFLTILLALRRRWVLATCVGLILAAAVAPAVWFLLPPAQPQVYARVYMPERAVGNWREHPDPPLQRQTQIALVKDPLTLSAVLRRDEIAKLSVVKEQTSPEEWLMRELRVEFPFGSEIMQFTMYGDRPQELKAIITAVRDVYLNNFGDETRRERQERLKRLRDYDGAAKSDIDNLRDQLKKSAQSGRNIDKETNQLKQKAFLEMLDFNRKELIRTQSDLRKYQIDLKLLTEETTQSINPAGKLMDDFLNEHPALRPLREDQARLEKLVDDYKTTAPNHPKVAELRSKLEDVKKQIDAKKLELRPRVLAEANAKLGANRESSLAEVRYKIKEREETCKLLADAVKELEKQSLSLNSESVTIDEEQKRIEMLEGIRRSLGSTIEHLRAELDAPARVQAHGETTIITPDELSRRIRFSAAAAAGMLLIGLLVIALLELRLRRINSPDEVFDGLGLPVVGTVPAPPRRLGGVLAGATDADSDGIWQTVLTESVDSFRTRLLHTARTHSLQVVMVSSADSGEGKTSLACHLALSLARSGLKTLLVDADLRNPTTHALFQMALVPGLSEVLREIVPTEEAAKPTPVSGLWLLPAGACNSRVIELLAQDALSQVFFKLRQGFDFIVVDSSPILPVADPLLIAQHADGVVFSLMREVSRLGAAKEAIDRLHALNVFTLGAVVNGAQSSSYGYRRKYVYPMTTN